MAGPKDPVDRRKARVNRVAIIGNPNIDEVTVTDLGGGKKGLDMSASLVAGSAVDTELPPAVAVADALTPASSPSIISLMYQWNGTSWDRVKKGQQIKANSVPVVIASDQGALSVVFADGVETNDAFPGGKYEPVISLAYLYNGSTFDRARGDIANGLDVDVTRLPTKDPAGVARDPRTDTVGTLQAVMGLLKIRVDDAGSGITYVGEAQPGASLAAAVWRIKRITDSGSPTDTDVDWADGDINFDNIWNNRASLSYS
jgi:hypothetical protein